MPVPATSSSSPTTLPLHRIRFYDQTPSPITCLAFPPAPLPPARDPSHKGKDREVNPASHQQGRADELGVLVVARENGDVEIHEWGRENDQAYGNWTCAKVLPPTLTHPSVSLMALVIRDPDNFHSKPYSVPKLQDLRLFTSGSDSTDLVERCLETGRILSTYPIPSPPLWSISVSPTHQLLALATSSPSLHFLSISSHSGPLGPPPAHLLRSEGLPSRTRTVSLAWGIPKIVKSVEEPGEWVWRDTYIVTGNSDSSFRKWDIPEESSGVTAGRPGQGRVTIQSRAVVEKIGKVRGKKVNKGTIVWGTAVLPDHTIVTSDSLGSVTFWDGASMAQKQTFSAHRADGMCLTVGPSGQTVFTSGPDQRVCQFTYIPSSGQWALTSTKRLHSHDVRALSIFPSYTPCPPSFAPASPFQADLAPILASGGWDMSLTLTPAAPPSLLSEQLRNPLGKNVGKSRCVFEESFTRKLGYLAQGADDRIGMSKIGRLVVGRKDRSVGVWRVHQDEEGWEKVLEMDFRLRTNLISSSISQDGKYLAVSDLYETKLFRLVHESDTSSTIRPVRIKSFLSTVTDSPHTSHLDLASKGMGSSTIFFTPDSRRLILGHVQSGNVVVVQLPAHADPETRVEVLKCFRPGGNVVAGRVIAGGGGGGGRRRQRKLAKLNGQVNGHGNDSAHAKDSQSEDVEMNGDEEPETEREEAHQDSPETDQEGAWIACLAASEDGQWLVSSDTLGRVTVYNLDTLQVHATLPTLPVPPTQLMFPSTSPSLLLILSPHALTAYHIERRRLLPPTSSPQLAEINTALLVRYLPALGGCLDGSGKKLVIWGAEYLLTARLDLSPNASSAMSSKKASRRKRAREAREALERSTSLSLSGAGAGALDSPSIASSPYSGSFPTSGSASNDNGPAGDEVQPLVKVHGGEMFRNIIGVGWLGTGSGSGSGSSGGDELAVVERPTSDFLGDLPPAFVVASFGRS